MGLISKKTLTANGQLHKKDNADFKGQNIQNEVAKIVGSDTVVNPRAVTEEGKLGLYLIGPWV